MVSFVELLHLPTVGRNPSLATTDFDPKHLDFVSDAIIHGRARHIFLPSSVANLMRRTRRFPWLATQPMQTEGPFRCWYRSADKTVHANKHFSAWYSKGEQAAELAAIRSLIPPMADALALNRSGERN